MRSLMLRLMLRRSRLRSLSDEFFMAPGGEATELGNSLDTTLHTRWAKKNYDRGFTELTDDVDVDRC